MYSYQYPRAALTVDCVVFGFDEGELKVLLIERALEPFKGRWALPGGFVRVDETVAEAARRELVEETGLRDVYLEQLYTFGEVGRDPRERVVSVAHYALVKLSDHRAKAATDAANAQWFPVSKTPKLAFDHAEILAVARERLRGKVRYSAHRFRAAGGEIHFVAASAPLRGGAGNRARQTELPEKGPELRIAHGAPGEADDGPAPSGAVVPL